MRISFDVSEFVQVIDRQDTKGNTVKYLRLFGEPTLYLVDRRDSGMTNTDWEEIFRIRLSRFFGSVLSSEDWGTEPPTGRGLSSRVDYVDYVREDES